MASCGRRLRDNQLAAVPLRCQAPATAASISYLSLCRLQRDGSHVMPTLQRNSMLLLDNDVELDLVVASL